MNDQPKQVKFTDKEKLERRRAACRRYYHKQKEKIKKEKKKIKLKKKNIFLKKMPNKNIMLIMLEKENNIKQPII
tara:strand:- start:2736 stop:2960 length:225 start_codon:yes stop_codon:yes gene_type:complete